MTMLTEELMTISRLLMFVSTYRWTYQWNWSTSKILAVKTMFCFKYHPVHLFKLILLCSHVKYLFDRIQIDDFFIRVNWKRNHQMKFWRKNNFDLDWLPPAVCQSKAPLLGAGTSGTETWMCGEKETSFVTHIRR